jgi:DNA polymerase I-like protein with 3'-5' exonuclease and polymerase domains
MIIDNEKDYLKFLNNYNQHDLIINTLGCDERYHPVVDELCAVFIKSITDGRDFVLSVNHPDGVWNIDKNRLINDLNKLNTNIWTFDKKKTLHFLPVLKMKDIQVYDYMENGEIVDVTQYQSKVYSFYNHMYGKYSDLNCVIPLSIHVESFENLADSALERIRNLQTDQIFNRFNSEIVECFQSIESNGLKVDELGFQQHFGHKECKIKNDYVHTEYNLFTSTGRPSNRFGNINYAALKKDDGCRSAFVSRYGEDGYLFMIDYSAYHPRLIAQLVRYDLPDDVYNYLGKYYFNKETLTDEELKAAKTTTFQLLYGNIPEKYAHVPYFIKIKEYIEHRWNHFSTHGYVETPIYKRRITPNNISEPNPNKLFNYILQATETEYNTAVLRDLVVHLKHRLTKPILYTYDSVLFDVSNQDGIDVLKQIKNIMSPNNILPVKCYKGKNYNEMQLISI